jgi:hypothetical protein
LWEKQRQKQKQPQILRLRLAQRDAPNFAQDDRPLSADSTIWLAALCRYGRVIQLYLPESGASSKGPGLKAPHFISLIQGAEAPCSLRIRYLRIPQPGWLLYVDTAWYYSCICRNLGQAAKARA